MSFKYLGGCLTPGQEFVCFRCRLGWIGPYTSLARRNVQTETQSVSSSFEKVLGLISSLPIAEKSTPGAISPGKLRRRKTRKGRSLKAAKDSASKDIRVSISLMNKIFYIHVICHDSAIEDS